MFKENNEEEEERINVFINKIKSNYYLHVYKVAIILIIQFQLKRQNFCNIYEGTQTFIRSYLKGTGTIFITR